MKYDFIVPLSNYNLETDDSRLVRNIFEKKSKKSSSVILTQVLPVEVPHRKKPITYILYCNKYYKELHLLEIKPNSCNTN